MLEFLSSWEQGCGGQEPSVLGCPQRAVLQKLPVLLCADVLSSVQAASPRHCTRLALQLCLYRIALIFLVQSGLFSLLVKVMVVMTDISYQSDVVDS